MAALEPAPPLEALKPSPLRRMARAFTSAPAISTRHVDVADGVRALCIALVGWFHFWQQSWLEPSLTLFGHKFNLLGVVRTGYLQVDVLLMLSGFLLFLPHARTLVEGADRPKASVFYQRRAMRILPSYWLGMAVLLVISIIRHNYPSLRAMWFDTWTHLTFTHNFFPETYFYTNYLGVVWTLAVEVQFYLLFPLIARAFAKKPLLCYAGMVGIAFAFRAWAFSPTANVDMLKNQLPALLDVYANGMLAALAYVLLAKRMRPNGGTRIAATLIAAGLLVALFWLHQTQAHISTSPQIEYGQMVRRYPLSLCAALLLVSASHAVGWFRWLFANRAMRFFAAISFQFYLWHQFFATNMRVTWRFPPYQALENPQMMGERPWQIQYMVLCWVISIAVSALLTYAWEKPMAQAFAKLFARLGRRPKDQPTSQPPAATT